MKAAAQYIIQADESTQKALGVLMPHMLDVNIKLTALTNSLHFIDFITCDCLS